jgi:hypothetical protein
MPIVIESVSIEKFLSWFYFLILYY